MTSGGNSDRSFNEFAVLSTTKKKQKYANGKELYYLSRMLKISLLRLSPFFAPYLASFPSMKIIVG